MKYSYSMPNAMENYYRLSAVSKMEEITCNVISVKKKNDIEHKGEFRISLKYHILIF